VPVEYTIPQGKQKDSGVRKNPNYR